MKKAKYVIGFLLIGIMIVLSGEVCQNHLANFEAGTKYTSFNTGDSQEWISFCKEAKEQCQEKGIRMFVKRQWSDQISRSQITIFSDEADWVRETYHVTEGMYSSLFSGTASVEFLPYDEILEADMGAAKFYLTGDAQKILSMNRYLNDKYGTSFIKIDTVDNLQLMLYLAMGAVLIFLMLLTFFDVGFQKKEIMVRLSLGESVWKMIHQNIWMDIFVFCGIFAVWCAVLSRWVSFWFYGRQLILFEGALLVLNSLAYLTLLSMNVRKALTNHYSNDNLLLGCYLLKIGTVSITIFAVTSCITTAYKQYDFLQQYHDVSEFGAYSQLDFRYYNVTDDTSDLYMKYSCSIFREKYDAYHVAFSTKSVDYGDDTIYLNVNQEASVVLEQIPEFANVDEGKQIHIFIPGEKEEMEAEHVEIALYSGSCLYSDIENLPYEIVYYDTAEVLYFDESLELNTGIAENPVICYFTMDADDIVPMDQENPDNIIYEFRNIMFRVNEEDLLQFTEEYELRKNGFYMTSVNAVERYEQFRIGIVRKLVTSSVIGLLFFLFGVAVTGTIVRLEYYSKSVELAVKKVLGYSIIKKNKTMLLTLLYTCVISTVIIVLIGKMTNYVSWYAAIGTGLFILGIEMLIVAGYVRKVEHMIVGRILKGGAL